MSEQKDMEFDNQFSHSDSSNDNINDKNNIDNDNNNDLEAENDNTAPENTVNEEPTPSWQAERPNPEQQIPSLQDQQPYPGQFYPEPPYPGQQNQQTYPGQQNQQTYPGHQNQPPYPGQQGQGQQGMPWQNQQFPNIPPTGGGNFYPNQNPNFQNPNMQNQNMQNMQGPNIPNPNLQNTNFQGQQGMGRPPVNPMAATSLVLGIISLLVSCCCFPVGFIVGFVLAMVGLVLAISSKKGKPFSGYAIAGLIVSILGICESLFLFFSYILTVKMMQDPNFSSLMNQIMEQYERSLGPQMISSILRKLL